MSHPTHDELYGREPGGPATPAPARPTWASRPGGGRVQRPDVAEVWSLPRGCAGVPRGSVALGRQANAGSEGSRLEVPALGRVLDSARRLFGLLTIPPGILSGCPDFVRWAGIGDPRAVPWPRAGVGVARGADPRSRGTSLPWPGRGAGTSALVPGGPCSVPPPLRRGGPAVARLRYVSRRDSASATTLDAAWCSSSSAMRSSIGRSGAARACSGQSLRRKIMPS